MQEEIFNIINARVFFLPQQKPKYYLLISLNIK